MRKIISNQEVCIGCRLCEINCVVAHSNSKNIIKAFKRESPSLPRILVEEIKPVSFAIFCRHCEEPSCVYSCLTGAMFKDEKGRVLHNREKCIGCWTCITVCPYGAIKRNSDNKTVLKCDLCADLEVPACVLGCPNGALEFFESEEA